MKRILYFLILSLFVSCNKEKINLPPLLENILPSKSGMPFNLVSSENRFPYKIKRFCQLQNTDTLNILEFDKNKNLIFKYYKQYVSKYWPDEFIYMIELNIYDNNKLVKTYYLHSNTEYELFTYHYNDENLTEMKSFQIGHIKSNNDNPYYFIKKIKDYKACLKFVNKIENDHKKRLTYTISRKFSNNEVIESFNSELEDGTYKHYILDDNKYLKRIEYYAKGIKWDTNTKYFKYDSSNNLKKTYSLNKNRDTLKSTEYKNKNSNKIVIKKEMNFEISRKEFLNNTLVKYNYQGVDSSYYGVENYLLDKFGIPVKIIKKTRERDTTYNLKNYYEFYK